MAQNPHVHLCTLRFLADFRLVLAALASFFNILLAALRWHGYRSENRYLVFQVLEQTLGIAPEVWRVLAKCHQMRNLAEYEGHLEIDDQLLVDLIKAGALLLEKVSALGNIAR